MSRRFGRGLARATIALVVVLGIAACGSSEPGNSNTKSATTLSGGTLEFAIPADPGNLDPQRSLNDPNLTLGLFAYDTPVSLGADGKPVPEVVSSWEASSTKEYVLTVRKGVTCASGSAMNAQVVAQNINYVADPKNGSAMTGLSVPPGTKATADPAASTVTVSLPAPQSFFIQNLATLPLVCKKGLTDRAALARTTDGSGPYVLSSEAPGVSYTYVVRKGYTWGPNGATSADLPTKVTVPVVASPTTMENELLSGQLNVAQVPISSTANVARLKAGGLFSSSANAINNMLAFNESGGPPAEVAVRRALIAGINLSDAAKIDTGGLGTEADGLIASPKICAGNTMAGNTPAYDPTAAAAELSQAGWNPGPGGVRTKDGEKLSISLIFNNSQPNTAATAQYIGEQWKNLGVDVTLNEQSYNQQSAVVFGHGAWDATLINIGITNPEQGTVALSGPPPTAGTNFGHFDNQVYNSLTAKATTLSGIESCPDWNKAESSLFKDADITPISDAPLTYWGKDARFEVAGALGFLLPTSLRATEG